MNIHLIIGPVYAGKTTATREWFPQDRYVKCYPGQVVRAAVGMGHAKQEDNPNRWAVMDPFIAALITNSLVLANQMGRCLAIDGYPRVEAQAVQLADMVQTVCPDANIVVHAMMVSEAVQYSRAKKRLGLTKQPVPLVEAARITQSRLDFTEVWDHFLNRTTYGHNPLNLEFREHDTYVDGETADAGCREDTDKSGS